MDGGNLTHIAKRKRNVEILERFLNGEDRKDIAAMYRLGDSYIANIIVTTCYRIRNKLSSNDNFVASIGQSKNLAAVTRNKELWLDLIRKYRMHVERDFDPNNIYSVLKRALTYIKDPENFFISEREELLRAMEYHVKRDLNR